MSGEHEEVRRRVDDLPDDQVPFAPADLRERSTPVPSPPGVPWPPAFFNSMGTSRTDMGRNHDDVLAEGFGRSW